MLYSEIDVHKLNQYSEYDTIRFENAKIFCNEKIALANGGYEMGDSVVVRIFTDDEVDIQLGDKVSLAAKNSNNINKKRYTVAAIADCRRGSKRMRHWRINLR